MQSSSLPWAKICSLLGQDFFPRRTPILVAETIFGRVVPASATLAWKDMTRIMFNQISLIPPLAPTTTQHDLCWLALWSTLQRLFEAAKLSQPGSHQLWLKWSPVNPTPATRFREQALPTFHARPITGKDIWTTPAHPYWSGIPFTSLSRAGALLWCPRSSLVVHAPLRWILASILRMYYPL